MTPFQISEGIYVAAIFTAKVTHWKKNAICTKALFLSLSCEGRCVGRAGVRAIRRDLLSALTLNEAWCFLSRWPATSLTIWAACSSFCSVCSESLHLFFGGWGGGYLEAQTGQARWEMVYWSSLYEVLMWWRANSPRRPPRFHPVIWFLKWMGFSIYQHGGLRPDIHKEPLRPHRGCRTSWDLLCQPWVALACMPREKCFAV